MSDVRFAAGAQPAGDPTDQALVREVKARLARGDSAAAQRPFAMLVERYQRRAARIAYHYLRDPVEVEEAVQDAFLKVFTHLPACRAESRFHLWFTRIVVNGCLDRLKARTRRRRWLVAADTDDTACTSGARRTVRPPRARCSLARPAAACWKPSSACRIGNDRPCCLPVSRDIRPGRPAPSSG